MDQYTEGGGGGGVLLQTTTHKTWKKNLYITLIGNVNLIQGSYMQHVMSGIFNEGPRIKTYWQGV